MKHQQNTIIVKILHVIIKKKSSEVAFHEGIDEKCVEIVGTGGPPEYLQ